MKKYTQPAAYIVEHTDRNITGGLASTEQVIPSPGLNRRIVVTSVLVCNAEAQGTVTITLQDGGRDRWIFYATAGSYLSKDFPANHPWKLSADAPLTINVNAANTVYYSIQYHVENC